jgi:16S rRNA (guanine966-N2)-methyltransferase
VGELRVRIIAGQFKGHRITAPKGLATRPTSDRVRESLFSTLTSLVGSDLGRASALDLFAGSGALGLEALSRGAVWATFVESDARAAQALRDNIRQLGLEERTTVLAGDAFALARRQPIKGAPFSLLLLDPPYRIGAAEVSAVIVDLAEAGALTDDAVVAWEHDATTAPSWPEGFVLHARKTLGSTALDIAVRVRGVAST